MGLDCHRSARALVVLVASLSPGASLAEELPIVVVPIIVGEAPSLRAADLHRAVTEAARGRARLRILSVEEAFVAGTRLDELESCGADPLCLQRELAASRAAMALIVLANVMTDPPLIALRLFDVRARAIVGSSSAPLGLDDEDIERVVAVRAGALLDGAGLRRGARLRVDVVPHDATLIVSGGAQDPLDAAVFVLSVGTTSVRAERPGYVAKEVEVVAIEGGNVELTITLEREGEVDLLASPWFWGAAIATVALGGALIFAAAQGGRCVCVEGAPCAC